jgi:hypothetical protein
MPGRTAKSVSAIFAAILGIIPLTTASRSETAAPDNCLTAPKGDAPPHSHWFYRIEHGTKRHCWYLRGSDQLAAPQNIIPPAKMTAPQPDVPTPRSLANARAEIPARTDRSDAPNSDSSSLTAPWNAARSNAPGPNGASSAVAARWPEPFAASRSVASQPATVNLVSADPPAPIASAVLADAAAAPADDDSPTHRERGILPILVALTGALTLAGLIIAKFGRALKSRPRKFRARRGPIWELTDDDRIVLSDDATSYDLPRRSAFPQTARSRTRIDRRADSRGDTSRRRAGQARP